jgi:moderate conductance mechanosensitive channel
MRFLDLPPLFDLPHLAPSEIAESGAEVLAWLTGEPLYIIGLIAFAFVVRWLLHRLVDRVVRRAETGVLPARVWRDGHPKEKSRSSSTISARRALRARTMGTLLKSIISAVVFTVLVIMVLAELGYNIAPILAGAGVLGVAVGFGSQSLVKDFLSGVFMLVEDQYGVGDVVDLGSATGTVEAVSLRVTRLRDVDGTVWYVRNGEILRVGNMSQNWARTVLDIPVDYSEDLVHVREVLTEVAHDLWIDDEYQKVIIEEPEVWGVQSLDADSVVVRVTLKTAPMEQWNVAREMRERVKARFDLEEIEIPRHQRIVYQHLAATGAFPSDAAPPATDG